MNSDYERPLNPHIGHQHALFGSREYCLQEMQLDRLQALAISLEASKLDLETGTYRITHAIQAEIKINDYSKYLIWVEAEIKSRQTAQ